MDWLNVCWMRLFIYVSEKLILYHSNNNGSSRVSDLTDFKLEPLFFYIQVEFALL